MMKNSLRSKIWQYLIIFSLIIIVFLWLFQVIFINKYYQYTKTKDIKQIATKLLTGYKRENIYNTLDEISYQENLCIEITSSNSTLYRSSSSGNCLFSKSLLKEAFINSNQKEETYNLQNPQFANKTILEAIKLDDNLYAFLSTSLEPLDSTAKILKEQLTIISILILSSSLLIGYFISKRLSNPIVDISRKASLIAKGKMKKEFNSNSDILEIKNLNNSLNEMMIELSKTEELERDLLANVSHDLKTPLTMIKAYAEMVRDLTYNNKEKRDANLNIIIEETDRLALLVNDILTLSKLQQSMDNLNIEEFDLIMLVNNILKRFTIYQEKYNYIIKFKHTNIKKLIIKADQKKIEQVLYNLIINAINYTGDDMKVIVNISKVDDRYKVEVIDSGKGIDEKDLENIFDKYYKSAKKHKRNLYGTGLGLSIVKSIFILHNYEYGVTTKKGKGTSFYFYI